MEKPRQLTAPLAILWVTWYPQRLAILPIPNGRKKSIGSRSDRSGSRSVKPKKKPRQNPPAKSTQRKLRFDSAHPSVPRPIFRRLDENRRDN